MPHLGETLKPSVNERLASWASDRTRILPDI